MLLVKLALRVLFMYCTTQRQWKEADDRDAERQRVEWRGMNQERRGSAQGSYVYEEVLELRTSRAQPLLQKAPMAQKGFVSFQRRNEHCSFWKSARYLRTAPYTHFVLTSRITWNDVVSTVTAACSGINSASGEKRKKDKQQIQSWANVLLLWHFILPPSSCINQCPNLEKVIKLKWKQQHGIRETPWVTTMQLQHLTHFPLLLIALV